MSETGTDGTKNVGNTAKVRDRGQITISEQERVTLTLELFGTGGGEKYRDAPLGLLEHLVNHIVFTDAVLIAKVLRVEIARGNLAAIKWLFDLIDQFAKRGTMQPAEIQSFAELLIKSLESEAAAEAKLVEQEPAQLGSGELVVIEPVGELMVVEAGQ